MMGDMSKDSKWSSPRQVDRKTPKFSTTLSPEAQEALKDLAARWGCSMGAAIGRLVREEQERQERGKRK
jgi:hypothetical protein